jgi:hypothetical protein
LNLESVRLGLLEWDSHGRTSSFGFVKSWIAADVSAGLQGGGFLMQTGPGFGVSGADEFGVEEAVAEEIDGGGIFSISVVRLFEFKIPGPPGW